MAGQREWRVEGWWWMTCYAGVSPSCVPAVKIVSLHGRSKEHAALRPSSGRKMAGLRGADGLEPCSGAHEYSMCSSESSESSCHLQMAALLGCLGCHFGSYGLIDDSARLQPNGQVCRLKLVC